MKKRTKHQIQLFLTSFGIVLLILFTFVGYSSKQQTKPSGNLPTVTQSVTPLLTPTPTMYIQQQTQTNPSPTTQIPPVSVTSTSQPLTNGYCSNEKRGGQWICPDGYYCDNIPVKYDCPNGEPCAIQYQGTCRKYRPD